ncbi:hypothetical protein [Acinetobacter baumannii]|uniref:hypothetical protein n=1 Tax=Acinetobacter baumannii TaxID=470 RepID=UPI00294958F5|nr:hypothetical protein [Acinetobacter baumannii]MDV5702080.1 hypothetical protein [Acinetobacter baumannii]
MKPEQFIREFGVEKAREVVEGAIYPIFGYDPVGMNYIHKQCDVAPVRYSPNCNSWSEDYAIETILIEDLKRLVESLDLVKKLGGLQGAKAYVPDGYKSDRLKQAIKDHESIYGGGE